MERAKINQQKLHVLHHDGLPTHSMGVRTPQFSAQLGQFANPKQRQFSTGFTYNYYTTAEILTTDEWALLQECLLYTKWDNHSLTATEKLTDSPLAMGYASKQKTQNISN